MICNTCQIPVLDQNTLIIFGGLFLVFILVLCWGPFLSYIFDKTKRTSFKLTPKQLKKYEKVWNERIELLSEKGLSRSEAINFVDQTGELDEKQFLLYTQEI